METKQETEIKASKPNLITLETFAKLLAILAVISGVFGVSFQKGMNMHMGLNNIMGSYDIYEVYNSAILGYLYMLTPFLKIGFWGILFTFAWLIVVFFLIGLAVALTYKFEKKLTQAKEYFQKVVRDTTTAAKGSIVKTTLLSTLAGIAVSIISAVTSVVFFFFLIAIVLPAVFGVQLGGAYVDKELKKPPCKPVSVESLKQAFVRQCTQITIGGKELSGEVVLENKEGYFLRLNNAFLFASKDGKRCVYSGYARSEEVKKVGIEKFTFENSQIESLCESIPVS